jgi:hypothetical protein
MQAGVRASVGTSECRIAINRVGERQMTVGNTSRFVQADAIGEAPNDRSQTRPPWFVRTLTTPWRLVLAIALPYWIAVSTVRIAGIMLLEMDSPGYVTLPLAPRVFQHLAVMVIALGAYRAALALGWPPGRRLIAMAGHAALALGVGIVARPVLITFGLAMVPGYIQSFDANFAGYGLRVWQSTTLDFMISYILGLPLLAAVSASLDLRAAALERAQLREAWMQARLTALRMQLNPHFLFNTLNTIAGLAERDPKRTRVLTVALADLFRATLASLDREWTALDDEIAFAREYLRIQQARAAGMFDVTIECPRDCMSLRVPTMLLQPLIENAVLHGVADDQQPLSIRIVARRDVRDEATSMLTLEIENRTVGPLGAGRGGLGLGLSSTSERLEVCYGGRARFEHSVVAPGCYMVRISLPDAGHIPPRSNETGSRSDVARADR